MTLPSIGQLQAVASAARHLSFQQAANELNITASAVSHRIRDFENLTNTIMFHRDIRSIRLTTEGQSKLLSIRFILKNLERLVVTKKEQRAFKIAMPSLYFSQRVLPQLQSFNTEHPDLNIDIEVSIENKLQNRFDAVVTYEKVSKPNWQSKKLFTATEVLAIKKTKITTCQEETSPEYWLKKLPRIALSYSPHAWKPWLQSIQISQSAKTITVSNMTEALGAAKSGLGVAILIEELIGKEIEHNELAIIARSKKRNKAFYLANKSSMSHNSNFQLLGHWLMGL